MAVSIGRGRIGLHDVADVARRGAAVSLTPEAVRKMEDARATLEAWAAADRPIYGLTRGLGPRAAAVVPEAERAGFSVAALKGRAAGAGGWFEPEVARAALFVRAANLAEGGAGVRPLIVETMLAMLERGVTPLIPRVGSIGTSDLLLCANMGLPLIGLGRAEFDGEVMPGAEAMARAGIATLALTEKEGLSICASNAVSIGLGTLAALDVAELVELADLVAALTFEAFGGNPSPIDPRAAMARPAPGQVEASANLRRMLAGSTLFQPDGPRRLQDPISLRCVGPVHGSVRMALGWVAEGLDVELNARADNPLIISWMDEILPTGNFHSGHLAIAFDALRLALTQLASISTERCSRLMDPELSGLPFRLTNHGVTRAGVAHVGLTSRALGREVRHASAPASNDDVTPMGVEDEAPFTLLSVRRTVEQLGFLRQMLACEMIVAAQALDLRRPGRLPPPVEALHAFVRRHVDVIDDDRPTAEDIERLSAAIAAGEARAL